jgi:hypothetical protein
MMSLFGTTTKPSPGGKQVDGKDVDPKQPEVKQTVHKILANTVGGRGKAGMKPVKIWLWLPAVTATSAAATAQAPVTSLIPSNSGEFANLSALFDEFRVLRVQAHYALVASNAGVSPLDWCVAYDSADATAYGSIVTLLAAQRRLPPMHYTAGGGVSPLCVTATGFVREWDFAIPKGVIYQSGGGVAGSDTWSSAASSGATYGYLKAYVGAASAGTTTLEGYVGMLCEFRNRT